MGSEMCIRDRSVVTHLASEANLAACVEALGESDSVVRVTSVLRMEGQEK